MMMGSLGTPGDQPRKLLENMANFFDMESIVRTPRDQPSKLLESDLGRQARLVRLVR